MPRTTSTLPDDLHQLIEGSIAAGVFENKSDAIRHALRDYFLENEDERIAAVIRLYEEGNISLGKAARLAGVSRSDMVDILQAHDVEIQLGPVDMADATHEIDVARRLE